MRQEASGDTQIIAYEQLQFFDISFWFTKGRHLKSGKAQAEAAHTAPHQIYCVLVYGLSVTCRYVTSRIWKVIGEKRPINTCVEQSRTVCYD